MLAWRAIGATCRWSKSYHRDWRSLFSTLTVTNKRLTSESYDTLPQFTLRDEPFDATLRRTVPDVLLLFGGRRRASVLGARRARRYFDDRRAQLLRSFHRLAHSHACARSTGARGRHGHVRIVLIVATIVPCFMMPTRVPDSFAQKKRSCVAMRTAALSSRSRSINNENSLAAFGSSPDVGSSSSSAFACFVRAMAIPYLLPHAFRIVRDTAVGGTLRQPHPVEAGQRLVSGQIGTTGERTEVKPRFSSPLSARYMTVSGMYARWRFVSSGC